LIEVATNSMAQTVQRTRPSPMREDGPGEEPLSVRLSKAVLSAMPRSYNRYAFFTNL
jgi:hypothetical protein